MKKTIFVTTRNTKGKGLVIAMILWFIICFAFIGFSAFNIIKGFETESWSQTSATILSSEIGYSTSHSRHGGSSTTYGAKITYQYSVNGVSYTSNTISYGYAYSSDHDAASQLVDNYPVGKIVTIYYNPDNPSEAVLISGIDSSTWIFFSFGLFFSIIGIAIVIYYSTKRKERSSKQIDITLEKTSFVPGDTIDGTVRLNLRKQKYAKALKVAFVVNGDIEVKSPRASSTSYEIYRGEVVLDVDREYFNESYPFRIKIPLDIFEKLEKLQEEGSIGMERKFLEWGLNKGFGNYVEKNKWSVQVSLDIPKKLDIKKIVEIDVSNAS